MTIVLKFNFTKLTLSSQEKNITSKFRPMFSSQTKRTNTMQEKSSKSSALSTFLLFSLIWPNVKCKKKSAPFVFANFKSRLKNSFLMNWTKRMKTMCMCSHVRINSTSAVLRISLEKNTGQSVLFVRLFSGRWREINQMERWMWLWITHWPFPDTEKVPLSSTIIWTRVEEMESISLGLQERRICLIMRKGEKFLSCWGKRSIANWYLQLDAA